MNKTALLIGATGLVGNELLQQLLTHSGFDRIIVLGRRSTGKVHSKLTEHVIDFKNVEDWRGIVKGDVVFSALGTTINKAGSREAQYIIDHNYQFEFAKAASDNSISTYILVSSAGADLNSRLFYSKMKGELERDVKELRFKSIYFIRPSLLTGDRKEYRLGEKIGFIVLKALNSIGLLRKYKPVHAAVVAKAMINASMEARKGVTIAELEKVFSMAGEIN
jgi:uncharacterized protein YbjT (DUF2867 family)